MLVYLLGTSSTMSTAKPGATRRVSKAGGKKKGPSAKERFEKKHKLEMEEIEQIGARKENV